MNDRPTYEQFLKDVSKHKLTIVMDEGVNRILKFNDGSFNMAFQIVTFPGHLVYTGDMGTYTFERIEDMLQFFRRDTSDTDGRYRINPQYWSEKVLAQDRHHAITHYDHDLFVEAIKEDVKDYIESNPDCDPDRLTEEVEDDLLRDTFSNAQQAIEAVNRFEYTVPCTIKAGSYTLPSRKRLWVFQDFYEHRLESYSYHFIWCCYALVWGIAQYDAMKGLAQSE